MTSPDQISNATASCRHYSGILVYTSPDQIPDCVDQLEELPGVEVHHIDAGTGRLIAVLESDEFQDQERLLREVKASPLVLLAELAYYRRDDEPEESTLDHQAVDPAQNTNQTEARPAIERTNS